MSSARQVELTETALTLEAKASNRRTGLTATVRVKRSSDDFFFDFSDTTWKTIGSVVTLNEALVELSAGLDPGKYALDFDLTAGAGLSAGEVLTATYRLVGAGPPLDVEDEDYFLIVDSVYSTAGAVWDQLRAAHNVALSFGASVRLDSIGLQTGAITTAAYAAGAIDAAAIATDAIGAAELSLAAANKIRDTILSDATTFPGAAITEARLAELDPANLPADVDAILLDTGTTLPAEHAALAVLIGLNESEISAAARQTAVLARFTGIEGATFSTVTDSLEAIRDRGDIAWITGPLASAIADAVWDELRAGHAVPLSFGESVRLDSTGLQAAAITAAKFAAAAITSGVIADGAITEPKIATAAITAAKFAANAITSTVVADGTITEAKIAAAAITAAKFAAAAITATVIATDAIGADELASSAVDKIVDQTWREILADHSGVAGSTAAALAGADAVQFRVEQAYTRSISSPAGSRVRGLFALHQDGQFIALPGTARLAVEVREADGSLIDSDSAIAPNAEGYFEVEFDPWTLVPGTVDISIATITLSGVGPGTHVTAIVIAWPDFVPTI